jgi:hypothetical protein
MRRGVAEAQFLAEQKKALGEIERNRRRLRDQQKAYTRERETLRKRDAALDKLLAETKRQDAFWAAKQEALKAELKN